MYYVPFISLIIAISSLIITTLVNLRLQNKNQRNAIDSKLSYRDDLLKIASNSDINIEDIYKLRGIVRYASKEDINLLDIDSTNPEDYNYDRMSDTIIMYSDKLIDKYIENNNDKFKYKETETIRIFARYLIKYNWENITVDSKKLKEEKIEKAGMNSINMIKNLKDKKKTI